MAIKAITFDLWDTIVDDDSDEPKRAERGLRSKHDERRYLLWRAVADGGAVSPEDVSLAYDTADAAFNLVWRELHISWTVEQRLRVVLAGLGRKLGAAAFTRLIEETGQMEVAIPPDPIPGIGEALQALALNYKLAVVSDAIVTPGAGLRGILRGHGLEEYFSAFAFSDEVGHAKPHRAMFDAACIQLGVSCDEIIHIGDRDHNDIKGAQAVGGKAILFTGSRDGDRASTTADAICDSHLDLSAVVDRLAATV